jgi:hypothetical protein
MLDQAIRFGTITAHPDFSREGTLLEVGSGSRGISDFTAQTVVGMDVAFPTDPAPRMLAVRASALHLPFRNGAFEQVICSDMLEHLAAQQRITAIRELIRVTRVRLFLAFPCDASARKADVRLRRLYKWLGIRAPDWLLQHLERTIPDSAVVDQALSGMAVRIRRHDGESACAHFWVSLLISTRWLNRIWYAIFSDKPRRAQKLSKFGVLRGKNHYRRLWVIEPLERKDEI